MKTKTLEQHATALRMRGEGATQAAIGLALGVSKARAARIVEEAEARAKLAEFHATLTSEQKADLPIMLSGLSQGTAYALRHEEILFVKEALNAYLNEPRWLLRLPNFGKGRYRELGAMLAGFGLIEPEAVPAPQPPQSDEAKRRAEWAKVTKAMGYRMTGRSIDYIARMMRLTPRYVSELLKRGEDNSDLTARMEAHERSALLQRIADLEAELEKERARSHGLRIELHNMLNV